MFHRNREYTIKVLEAMENGVLNSKQIVIFFLSMVEDEIAKQFYERFIDWSEEREAWINEEYRGKRIINGKGYIK